jgi:hypothetical protein
MSSRNRLFNARTLVLGGLAVAAVAGAMKNRHRVAGLIGARSSAPDPYPSPSSAPVGTPSVVHNEPAPPPMVSNYDAPGPPANTATPIPAPEPEVRGDHGIDEAAEEAAAAKEAANIGFTTGTPPQYTSDDMHETADEAHRPLAEAGEGVDEGYEQAQAELIDNAEPAAGDPLEGERQLEDVIEATDSPFSGERQESLSLTDPGPVDDDAGEPGVSTAAHIHVDGAREPAEQPDLGPGPSKETAPLAPETADEGAPTTAGTSSGSALGETPAPAEEPAITSGEPATSAGSALGETPATDRPAYDTPAGESSATETPAAEKSSAVWRPEAGAQAEPMVEQQDDAAQDDAGTDAGTDAGAETTGTSPRQDDEDDGGSEWQTWSGRAVDR